MTIKELSELVNMSTSSITYIEAGKNPSLQTLRKLSNILESPIAYLGCYEKMPDDTIGQKIKKARYYQGLMVKEMAHKIGVNPKSLIAWEKNKYMPNPNNINLLKEYFKASGYVDLI